MKLTLIGVTALAFGASSGLIGFGLTDSPSLESARVPCTALEAECEPAATHSALSTEPISQGVASRIEDWQFTLATTLTRIERQLWAETGYPPIGN